MTTGREYHLRRKYGIDLSVFDNILALQDGKCYICGKLHQDVTGRRLSVDHNHKSGEVRGLLCTFCNRYVIGRHSNPDLFKRAYEYLTKESLNIYVPEIAIHKRTRTKRKRKARAAKPKGKANKDRA